MSEHSFSSLSESLRAWQASVNPLITVRLIVNHGGVTNIEYRRSFDPRDSLDHEDDQTDELTATVAALRRYGKTTGRSKKSHARYEVKFYLADRPEQLFVSDRLVSYMEAQAVQTGTVPAEVVSTVKTGVEQAVAETERRGELEALKVDEVRKLAASLKVAGAWKERKAVLIDRIITAEGAVAS